MSDIDITGAEDTGASRERSRTAQAREFIGQAGETLKAEAQSFASAAQDRARAEAQKQARTSAKTLGDFANAVRRAGEELAASDQSPASRLVRRAADGLEDLSRNLAGKPPEDLLNAVRDFGRRNPAAFIGGSVLLGLALGRFVRASEAGPSPPRLNDADLAFAEEDAFDGPSEPVGAEAGIDLPLADDLGGLSTAAGEAEASLEVGDETTPLREPGTGPAGVER